MLAPKAERLPHSNDTLARARQCELIRSLRQRTGVMPDDANSMATSAKVVFFENPLDQPDHSPLA
jgi:hypothetical protein